METIKSWRKVSSGNYDFLINEKIVGQMNINYHSNAYRASFKINDKTYFLKYPSIWKSDAYIEDENRSIVLKLYTEKWYANHFIVEFNNQILKLKTRNNPLAEYVLLDEAGAEILSYGLKTKDRKVVTQIGSHPSVTDSVLDFSLFSLFYPIAMENACDDALLFTLLVS